MGEEVEGGRLRSPACTCGVGVVVSFVVVLSVVIVVGIVVDVEVGVL
jgi:hypothetical protein